MNKPLGDDRSPAGRDGRTGGVVTLVFRLCRAALVAVAWAASLVLMAAAVVQAAGLRAWPFELVHHFVATYAMAAAILLVLALAMRDLRLTGATAPLFAFFIWVLAMPSGPTTSPPPSVLAASNAPVSAAVLPDISADGAAPSGRTISVVTNNVFCGNWDRHGLVNWLRSRPADIVVLQEVPRYINKLISDTSDAYPYSSRIISDRSKEPRVIGACQGIILLSRFPITSASIFHPIEDAWPALIAGVQVDESLNASLAIVHAADPVDPDGLRWRDQFLALLAGRLSTIHGPLIVLGDFNATPFTPALRAFAAAAGLTESPWQPATYPSVLGTFGISIDHVLVRDATVLRLAPLPAIGSDHRPLFASIALPAVSADAPSGLASRALRYRSITRPEPAPAEASRYEQPVNELKISDQEPQDADVALLLP